MEPRFLVLLALATAAIAGPITVKETNECATQCPTSTKMTYATGTTYVYDYRVDYSTSMLGASEDTAKMTLTTTANLEVLSPCEMALSLRDTRLFHSDAMGGLKAADREEMFRRGLEGSALRFSYQDGVVDHVCAGNREEPWTLNIKKGILSAFQNSMDDLSKSQNITETDVMGACETEYKTVSDGYYSDSVRKTKNVLTCTDRHDYKTILQMVPYNVPSELQSIPLLKTSHECDQVIQKGGFLQSTTCTETHMWRPFSNDKSGGATSVKQTLTYKTYSRGVSSKEDTVSSRDSLLFDHSATRPSTQEARNLAEQKLKEICESTAYDIRPESPRLFSELVYSLKSLDKQAMEEMFRQLKTKTICPGNDKAYKMFLDALPMTSTSASVSLMTSLIINEDVHGLHAKAWIASLALINAPTSEMLLDAKTLIDSDKQSEDALLPVSAMVNNFCFRSSECDQSYAVLSMMASLERSIGSQCDASGKDFQQILLTLRAIGNAGHATRAVPVITKCLTNSDNPLEIRVAAANAFRRMPCYAESTELWNTYESSDLDSELRIASYLALMRCPSDATLGKMATSLAGELDEQVGAFVYSHMTNLRQTSDPHKQTVARAMDNLEISNKYESDKMKASTNLEASALINKINTGFVAESNLIWSNNAQVPRSASANLTVELFGQSVNLFDFGGRLEGLEHLIKNLFGPYLGEEEAKKAKSISFDNVHGSVYGRFFGNEMMFLHSKQVSSPLEKLSNKWLDMIITLSKNQEVAFTHGGQFIDVSMIIPTAAGLPIHIDVNGSAVVDVLLNGKADFRKVSSSPRSLDIDGEIRPSAAMEVTGAMSVNAFVTKTGLRMRNTMHTSTSLKGRIQLERGQQLSIELDTPKDKMEVFDARSKFFILHNNVEQEQKMITENRKEFELCSCDKLAEITGAKLCGQISFPNASMQSEGPYFPLTGPSSASLVLRKSDTHSGYKLLAKRVENKKMSVAQISFNTPGSRVNRMILVDLTVNYPGQSIDAQVVSPWKQVAIAGALVNKKDMKSVTGSITIDESDIYAWTSEVKMSKSKGKVDWSPMVEIRQPGMETVQMKGFVSMVNGMKSVDMDLSLTGLQELPYSMKMSVSNTKKERSITASVSKDGGNSYYSMEASNKFSIMGKRATIVSARNMLKINTPKMEIVSMKATADYKEDKSLKLAGALDIDRVMRKPASFKLDILKNAKKRGVRYDVDANVKSNVFTGRVDSNMFIKNSGLVSSKTAVDYTIPKVAKNKIVLSGKFNDRSTKAYTKYILKSNLNVKKNPEYNVGLNFGFDHKKKHTAAEVEVKYGPNPKDKTKSLYLNVALNKKIPNYKNAVLVYKMKAQAPEHEIDLLLAGKHTHTPKMVDSDMKLTYAKNKSVSVSLLLEDRSSKAINMNGRASIAWPGSEYVLSSKLDKKSSELTHEINLKGTDGMKHSIDTVYKQAQAQGHTFSTVFHLQGLKKTTVSGSANLQSKNMLVSGEVKYGKDTYGLSTMAKKSKLPGGSLVIEAFNSDRRVVMKVDGEKAKNKMEGSVETSWDADKDESKKISIGGSVYNKQARKSVSLGGDVSFNSPFENFENLAGNFKYGSDASQHDISGKFSWGGTSKVMSSITLQKPMSLSHFVASIEAKSPFRKMRTVSAEISHTWEGALKTILKGHLNKENAKLVLEGEGTLSNMKGSMSLVSTIKNAEEVSGTLSHTCNPGKIVSNVAAVHNGKSYGYNLDMDHSMNGWQVNTNGDLLLTMPKSKVSTTWQHNSDDSMVKSQLSSRWGDKKFSAILTGTQDVSARGIINGELKIDSPWKSLGDVIVSVNHKHGNGVIKSKVEMMQHGTTKALSNVKFSTKGSNADLDFTIVSPWLEDMSGKLNAKYDTYPITSSGEFQWHPRRKITAEASVNAEKWDNAALDFKVSTPFRGYRNMNVRASNRKEGGEMISQANLGYGARKNIDLETRHSFEGQSKIARMRLSTPFDQVKTMDAGLRFDGKATNFDSSADFEMVPLVGKFQGSAKLHYDNDMTGTLRLDTPYPEYPYFELFASCNDKEQVRKSRVEARLHPQQIYSLDATYSFDLPISIEANVNSPYPEYNNLGLVFQHNHSPSTVASHAELRYQPEKKFEGDLNADWSSNVEGSMIVKTPFSGYEDNKLALRHQGDIDDFSSHGEVYVAQKRVVADANFKAGYTTTGSFALSSPIAGMENVELNLKKKGKAKNFRGEVTLAVNDKKIDADYNHRLTKTGLKSAFKLTTPYTENIKFSVEHNGKPEKFTNEISVNYGRKYDVDTVVSFDYNKPDVSGHGMIKYKLGGRRQAARLNFNKNGALNDMSFSGSAGLNDDEIDVSGAWKNQGAIEGHIKMNTPFKGFKTTGLTVSHDGRLNDFSSSFDVTYMDNKNINGKIALSAKGLQYIRLDSEIATPFKEFPSASLIFNHNYDEYRNTLNGDASLTTPAAGFGSGSLTYTKTGTLNNLDIVANARRNGREVGSFKLAHAMTDQRVHSSVQTEASQYPTFAFSFDHMGDLSKFNTKASGNLGDDNVFGEIYKKGPMNDLIIGGTAKYNNDAVEMSGTWHSQRGLDGNLEIKTPFDDFNDIGMSISHNGDASDFSSSARVEFMDNKVISGKVDVDTDGRFVSEVSTPFEGFEYTKVEANGAYDSQKGDLNAKVTLTTRINDFGNGEATFKKYGNLDDLAVDGSILRNNIEVANVKLTNSQTSDELHCTFNCKIDDLPEVSLVLDHNGVLNNFNTKAYANVGDKNVIEGEVKFNQKGLTVSADASGMYSIEHIGTNQGSVNLNKDGAIDDFTVRIVGNLNGQESTISGEMQLNDEMSGSLTINTPFRGYKNVGGSFKHQGILSKFNSEGQFNLVDEEQYSGKVDFYRNNNQMIEATLQLTTPIQGAEFNKVEYRHEIQTNALKCSAAVEYGQSKKITYDMSASTAPILDFSVTVKTPFNKYEEMMASAVFEAAWSKMSTINNANMKISGQLNGQESTISGEMKLDDEITGSLTVSTPLKGYRNVGASFRHQGIPSSFHTEGQFNLVDGKQYSTKVNFYRENNQLIDANMEVTTPIQGAELTKFEYRHDGQKDSFKCYAALEYGQFKKITYDLSASTSPNFDFNVALKTPFENYEDMTASAVVETINDISVKITGKLNDLESTISGEIKLEDEITGTLTVNTPLKGYNNVGLSFKHQGKPSSFNTEGRFNLIDGEQYSGKVNFYRKKYRLIEANVEVTTPIQGADFTKFEYRHEGQRSSFKCYAALEYGQSKKITYDMSASTSPNFDFTVAVKTPFYKYEEMMASAMVETPTTSDVSMKITGKVNGQESTISGEMKVNDEATGSLTINTPLNGYKNVGVYFRHQGNPSKFNSEGKFNLVDGEQYSTKVNFYRKNYQLIEASVEIKTPIQDAEFTKLEYNHETQRNAFKCSAALEYGLSKKITYDMSASTSPNVDFSVAINTPFFNYEEMTASATIETAWPQISMISNFNAGTGRVVNLRGTLDASKDITGSLNLKTPIKGFSDVGLGFEHSGKMKNFKSEARVTYMDGKEISGKVVFKQRRAYALAEMKTPFSGFEYTKCELSKKDASSASTTNTYFVYGNGKVTSTETVITFTPRPGFSFTINSPIQDYEEMMASASLDNSWPKLEFNGKASVGNDFQFSLDAAFDATNDISGSLDVKTPMDGFRKVGLNFAHSGNSQKFDSEGKITYMDGKDISGKMNFYKYMWRRLAATAELSTPFKGARNTKAEINYEDNSNGISATAALEYGRRQKMDGTMKLTYSPSFETLVTINTPFDDYKTIRAQGTLDVTAPSYSAGYSMNYGYNTAYSATGKLNLYAVENIDGSLEVVLPIRGMEYTKADYQHKFDSSRLDGSVSLTYGNSKTITGELKAAKVPNYDVTVVVKTPFEGYENMQGSATYDNSYNKYDTSSYLSLGSGYSFSMLSSLDMSTEPYRASTQISTPFDDYRNMELVVTHEGSISDFRCTGFLSTPITDTLNAATNVKYSTLSDMEASASIKSSFEGMDDLLAEMKTSDMAGEKKARVVLGWTRGQQISADTMLRQQESWYENKVYGEMNLATPFEAVRSLAIQAEHTGKQEAAKQMVSLEHNGEKLLDLDTEYSSKDKRQGSVTFRKPLPMQYTMSASSNAGVTEAEVLANWNRDEMDSNVHITASINDQSDSYNTERSVDIGVEHASRKMGITHKLSTSSPSTTSYGKIYWDSDDSSRIFYDMQVKDNSRRRREVKEGHFTVGLPSRTFGLSGSYSDNQVVKGGDVAFSWDSNHEDKQIGLKGTITRGDRIKGDVTLSMPAIRKDIRIDGELMSQNGRIILDARTDISYSKDSRKTLTLTSKLEDISDYYSHYNYSLAVGVSHPYTNVDIQMTSHLGCSDEKVTVGLNTDYMTARRQNKNLGLLAEINKLKRQLSLQVNNPYNKVEIAGGVVSTSPYKVNMVSKVDDVEMFRSDLTMNEDKKAIEINMFEGSEGLKLSAGYPSLKDFRSEISRISYGRERSQALLAVRLNTTRLMHTRLHWEPNMLNGVWQAVEERAMVEGVRAAEALNEINMAFSDELAGKYTDITSAFSEELKPLIDELEKEMAQVAREMYKLSKGMRKAYKNNDFYVQDMGQSMNEAYINTQKKLASLTREYRKASAEIIESLSKGLQEMTSFPIKERYSEMISSSTSWLNERIEKALSCLESYLAKADAALTEYHDKITELRQKAKDSVYNATYVTYISDSLNNVDITPYIPSVEIPEEYTNAIYNVHNAINTGVGHMMDAPGLRHVKGGLNEVYQQGVWAYNYWQLEKNIHAHAERVLKLIREIVEDEMKEYAEDLQGLYQNPITVWHPENGEVQAEFRLPMEVSRLDEVPDFTPLVNQISANMPDRKTLENISETVSNLWESTEDDDSVMKQLKRYRPSKKMRKAKKGRKYRVRTARN